MNEINDLKKFEEEIDTACEYFEGVFEYDTNSIVQMLFAQYDLLYNSALKQNNKGALSGAFSHCIRWAYKSKGTTQAFPKDDRAMKLIGEFFIKGITYNHICSLIAPSYGNEYNYEIDFLNKRAKFEFDSLSSIANQWHQIESRGIIRNHYEEELRRFTIQFCHYTYEKTKKKDLYRAMDWKAFLAGKNFARALGYFKNIILPVVSEKTSLGGYTVEEFRIFYTVIYLISSYNEIIGSYHRTKGKFLEIAPCAFTSSVEDHVSSFALVTGLSANVVESITKDLTFNENKFGSRITVRPFFRHNESISWLPSIVLRGYAGVSVSNLLYKEKRKVYDHLINEIETGWVIKHKDSFSENLKEKKVRVSDQKDWNISGKTISPDIVLFDDTHKTILVVEYKYFVSAYSYYDVSSQTKSVAKGFKQLIEYIDLLKEDYSEYEVYGSLMTQYPLSSLVKLHENKRVCIIDSYLMHLQINQFDTFRDLVKNFRRMFDLSKFTTETNELEFGGWKIQFEGLKPKDQNLSFFSQ